MIEKITEYFKRNSKVFNYAFAFLTAFVVIIILTTALSIFGVPGLFRLYVVQSGSMEPAILTGSVVVVETNQKVIDSLKTDDIITFRRPDSKTQVITHRIANIVDGNFETKGDANSTNDGWAVIKSQVLGKVLFAIPLIGYPVAFAKTVPGFIILILIPAIYVIISEALVIKRELAKRPAKGGA